MKHYNYQKTLHTLWEKGVQAYRDKAPKQEWYSDEELAFLASIGMTLQEMFDFCEDFVSGGEPDFTTVAMMQDVRRSYFLDKQHGKPSGKLVDTSTLPAKDSSVEGIEWLPRILPKAHAKLRGEMPEELMYCCGGDRRFFKNNDIHPAEFLRVVAQNEDDEAAIIAWVKKRVG